MAMMREGVRDHILIVEDHPLYRDGLVQLLKSDARLSWLEISTAESAEEGIRVAKRIASLRLIVLDPGLRGMRGAQAVAAIAGTVPGVPVLALSASEDRRDAAATLRAGACTFVSKEVPTDVLKRTILLILAGGLPGGSWVTCAGTGLLAAGGDTALTPRQREILGLLCDGHSNKEISLRLGLAEVTVKMHVSLVLKALGVATRTQAVAVAHRWGLRDPVPAAEEKSPGGARHGGPREEAGA
jgi:DNA-binding NarL/FixJ family response regulator